ncbi:MAG: tRNA uridine-5-carboxymethylaminomethyl(34) synthesis GTPase MnmE [Pseudomonadota bacterium]
MTASKDTIAAIATPPGRGGVGIVRVSGPRALAIGSAVLGRETLPRRQVVFGAFRDGDGQPLDEGIALYFQGPRSFTGEDVVELQGHGGPVVMDLLLRRVLALGARMARPGEFSERAFLNDRLDLAQAEAIADLIDAGSEAAARSAVRSLEGVFSQKVSALVEGLIHLRMYVEAAIDFPDEDVDFLSDGHVETELRGLMTALADVQAQARQGALLREGMQVVIAGRPNAGKSSLMNALAGFEAAIVTDIAGTTRDVLRERIQVDGMPLHVVDTAGLRATDDVVEKEGVRRALAEVEKADCVLFVYDLRGRDAVPAGAAASAADSSNASLPAGTSAAHRDATGQDSLRAPDLLAGPDPLAQAAEYFSPLPPPSRLLLVANKCDLVTGADAGRRLRAGPGGDYEEIVLSAQAGAGLPALREALKQRMGFQSGEAGVFTARRRHLDALSRAGAAMDVALQQLLGAAAGELVAEDLRVAQHALAEITGEFTPDDLLGRIFSSFCIGK